MKSHKMTQELALRPQYAQYPNPNPKPELFGQTRPEPDPKSKSPTRQTLVKGYAYRVLEGHGWAYRVSGGQGVGLEGLKVSRSKGLKVSRS